MRRLMEWAVPDVALLTIGYVPGFDAESLFTDAGWPPPAVAYLIGAAA